jgi:hypothetical protein
MMFAATCKTTVMQMAARNPAATTPLVLYTKFKKRLITGQYVLMH